MTRPQNTQEYTDHEMYEAMEEVKRMTGLKVLSREAYNLNREPHHPHSDTIEVRLGRWSEIRP